MDNKEIKDLLQLQKTNTIARISKCNEFTSQYQLALTQQDIESLIACQGEELKYTGRIQFGDSIIPKFIFEFCDSQYISQDNYVDTLNELQEIFYYLKNESYDEVSDDELIQGMRKYYDSECQGSLEYLRSNYLDDMLKKEKFIEDIYDQDVLNDEFN